MHLEFGDAIGNGPPGAGQKRGAHPIGHRAQPQIKAGGLHLTGGKRMVGGNGAAVDQAADRLRWQNPGCRHHSPQTAGAGNETARTLLPRAGRFSMVGPGRFELPTFRPPDGRANQAALRPELRRYIAIFAAGASGKAQKNVISTMALQARKQIACQIGHRGQIIGVARVAGQGAQRSRPPDHTGLCRDFSIGCRDRCLDLRHFL